ncbi:MAG: molybdopterin-dependent oxidoreductase [Proteobacteria bacterium]|nr:molybdopterin-dependent oxidoreductase [Pseudomonadota bacterium]
MGKLATIARRTFLIGSAAVAGGVAFGVYQAKKTLPNPLKEDAPAGAAVFNPWVLIDAQGITLIAPHTDLGQGVRSMQAALIAEELDVDLNQVRVTPGAPSAAYYNTATADESVPFLSTDDSWQADAARGAVGTVIRMLGMQVTGGSTAVPDSFVKLRQAGAMARETLKLAASEQSGVPVAQLKTAQGAVLLPDGRKLPYTQLAARAAQLKPVQDVPLRPPEQWRLLGKPMQRVDVLDKSTGRLKYGIDLAMDGMLIAAVRLNPHNGAPLKRFDAKAAEGMRGVKKVLPVTSGVAVVADNTWRAFKAAEAVDCEWADAPYPANQADHWKAVADTFGNDGRLDKVWRNDGDVDAFTGATNPHTITAEYRAPYLAHAPLEPLAAVVKVSPERVDVWVSHQIPRVAQQKVAAIVGQPESQVHLHNQYSGGSFGHRLEFDHVTLAAEVAKQMPGVPIKLVFRREEDFAHDYPRQIGMARGRGAVDGGQVQALGLDIATVSSSASQFGRMGQAMPGPDGQIAAGAWNMAYALPHCRVRAYRVPELAPTSSWRSVGASTAGFFAESFMDELVHAAGADPLAERLRLARDERSRQLLQLLGRMCDWKGAKPAPGVGRGVAFVTSFGVPCAQVVEVRRLPEGIRIENVWVAVDVGPVIDPVNFENLVQGGVVWALGHAMNCEITYEGGKAQQSNFHAFTGMRLNQCPAIHVQALAGTAKIRGVGEPPVPPAAPALANAIFAATGQRIREMPFAKHIDFV